MKYLKPYNKLFENHKSIHDLCEKYRIANYTINDDSSINVDGDVNLLDKKLTKKLPLKFRNVSGSFYGNHLQLTSLEGSPQSVGGSFYCQANQLMSLEGAPQSVGGDFYCSYNKLKRLEGAPQSVGGHFYCHMNKLMSLEGAPQSVGGNYILDNNPCHLIYYWVNKENRDSLLELSNDYDFLRDDSIIWDRLIAFFVDNNMRLPKSTELEKYYNII